MMKYLPEKPNSDLMTPNHDGQVKMTGRGLGVKKGKHHRDIL
jgi:hypothetical protein